ncbi:MAG: hypothetical protein ABFS43_14390 [Thermodesulfobacteriota bacterium]
MAPASTRRMFKSKVVAWCLLLLMVFQGAALAQPDWLTQFDPGETYGEQMPWVQPLSSTYGSSSESSSGGSSGLDIGSLHKYLGWGTLLLACVTAVTGSDSSLHHNSALAATAFGLGTAATGYYEYSDYFDTDEGLSTYNLHIVLGTIGAIGFATEAVIASTDSGHGGIGIGSAVAMGLAFAIVIW